MAIPKKPKRYFKTSGDRCDRIRVTHLISKYHLIVALYQKLTTSGEWFSEFKPSAASVEKEVRDNLLLKGTEWFDDIDVEDKYIIFEGREETLNVDNWKIAEAKAKELFPKWFINYHNKSLRFITED